MITVVGEHDNRLSYSNNGMILEFLVIYPHHLKQNKIFQSLHVLLMILLSFRAMKARDKYVGGGTAGGKLALAGAISETKELDAPLLLWPLLFFLR